MTGKRRTSLALLIGLCGACGDAPLMPQFQLDAARSRWQAAGPPSYVFDLRLSCFCLQETYGTVSITVVDGRFVGEITSEGTSVDSLLFESYLTVDRALELTQRLLEAKPASFTASYDPSLGYPTMVSVDPNARAADDEISFRILALHAILPP
jgi:uncharacterized protein DUF6174